MLKFEVWTSLTIIPTQESSDKLQDLELLRIRSVQAEEMQEMVSDNVPIPPLVRVIDLFSK